MAKQSGLGWNAYIHGENLSGDVASINNLGGPRSVFDHTGISSFADEATLGRGTASLSFTAYFNKAVGQAHLTLSALPTTNIVCLIFKGSTRGNVCAGVGGKQVNYDGNIGTDGDMRLTVDVMGDGSPLEWGVLITSGEETHSSATSSSSLDENGAAGTSSKGAIGFLQYRERASGTPTFLIEDSANDSSWATLLTFANTGGTSAFGERKTVTGSVDRYLRLTTTGSFSNADFVVGFKRGTDVDDEDLS